MMDKKQWQARDEPLALAMETLGSDLSPLTRKLLLQRGFFARAAAEQFLHPSYERDIHDPFLIAGMEKAVKRILVALAK